MKIKKDNFFYGLVKHKLSMHDPKNKEHTAINFIGEVFIIIWLFSSILFAIIFCFVFEYGKHYLLGYDVLRIVGIFFMGYIGIFFFVLFSLGVISIFIPKNHKKLIVVD